MATPADAQTEVFEKTLGEEGYQPVSSLWQLRTDSPSFQSGVSSPSLTERCSCDTQVYGGSGAPLLGLFTRDGLHIAADAFLKETNKLLPERDLVLKTGRFVEVCPRKGVQRPPLSLFSEE